MSADFAQIDWLPALFIALFLQVILNPEELNVAFVHLVVLRA
jgi:hypothetical protein